jgi:hypothetical protein
MARVGEMEPVLGIGLRLVELVARELVGGDRVEALDALRHFAVGDALHLERVKFAEVGDLIEGQRRIFDQPHGGRFGHQGRGIAHGSLRLCDSPGVAIRHATEPRAILEINGVGGYIRAERLGRNQCL